MDSDLDKNKDKKDNSVDIAFVNQDIERSVFSQKDNNTLFVYKKTKKLVAAIYLLTDFLNDTEPLKSSLRQTGNALLASVSSMATASRAELGLLEKSISAGILEVISLLEVGTVAGLVSPMNLDVIKNEFGYILPKIESIKHNFGKSLPRVGSHFFALSKEEVEPLGDQATTPTEIKDNQNVLYNNLHENGSMAENDREVTFNNLPGQKGKFRDFGSVAVKKNKRQSVIINLLKRKKEVIIKDLVGVISGCSEKTIQRELALLVEAGILKKEGERRWTRYRLA